MYKIKFDIGHGEIVNAWCMLHKIGEYYTIFFANGAYDTRCAFDYSRRCFYGAV